MDFHLIRLEALELFFSLDEDELTFVGNYQTDSYTSFSFIWLQMKSLALYNSYCCHIDIFLLHAIKIYYILQVETGMKFTINTLPN